MATTATPAAGPAALQGKVQQSYLNTIGGQWVASESGRTFENRNPADTREVIAIFPDGTPADVKKAIDAAQAAFKGWMGTPAPQRQAILAKGIAEMRARAEELAQALTWEEGKVLAEARVEVNRGLSAMEYLAAEGRRMFGQTIPSDQPGMQTYTQRRPKGVVGIITPWNFPFAIPAWKLAAALVCGNTVVFKPAEQTPLCAQLLVEALIDAGLPPGVLNMVHGGPEVGEALVTDSRVRAISFTGSTEVGKLINRKASEHMAKVQLEMGGKNACIVMADADLDKAAKDIVVGAFGSTGQRCTATSRVVVDRRVKDLLVEKILAEAKGVQTGNGFAEGIIMGPMVDERAIEKTEHYIDTAKKEGNQILLGGKRASSRPEHEHGYYFEPTIVAGVKRDHTLNQEEVFGPVLSILEADTLDEALDLANSVEYGLCGAIYTKDVSNAFQYTKWAEHGMLHVNCPSIYSEVHLPFGGLKESGFGGREMGPYAIDFWTEWQAVYIKYE
jgi:aldehyde dehydrogenase (NAD+)